MNVRKNIGIVLVTYNPNLTDFKRNLSQILLLNQEIMIIDNGSTKKVTSYLKEKARKNLNLNYKLLEDNKGIGFAQNEGIKFFISRSNIKYILFLDQDSYINSENLAKLENALSILIKKDTKNIMIGPKQDYEQNIVGVQECDELISSGSLVSKVAFNAVGKLRSDFFIDYVDYEWCWRAKRLGYKIYKTSEVKMQHETTGVVRYHHHTVDPVFRLYYIFRNSTYLMLYERIPWKVKINIFIRNNGKFIFQFFLKNKGIRIKTCVNGILDGVNQNLGRNKK